MLWVLKARIDRNIEADDALPPEEIANLVSGQLLGDGALPPEKAISALNGFGIAFSYRHNNDLSDRINEDLDRGITVPGDILNSRPQFI
jgi:hypothetical protein